MKELVYTYIMDDLQTIHEIVNESVRDSSYITVIISSSVFICYTLIVRLIDYFKSKSKSRPIIEMANAIKENTANIVKLNGVLDKTLRDAERKEANQCVRAIDVSFKALSFKLSQDISLIIAHNNIEVSKELIVSNLTKVVSAEYYKLYSILSAYEINEVNVASKLKTDWIKEITDAVVAIIYNGQDAITRITQINNRLTIQTNEYSTFVNNKIFNT